MTDRPDAYKPRTIAAQALGAIEPETKRRGLADPRLDHVHPRSGQSIPHRLCYGRPDNATVREAEAVIAALEGGARGAVFGSGMAAATSACSWPLPPATMWSRRRSCTGPARLAQERGAAVASRRPRRHAERRGRARRDAARTRSWYGSRRRPIRSGPSRTSQASRKSRTPAARILGIDSTAATPLFTSRSRSAPTS